MEKDTQFWKSFLAFKREHKIKAPIPSSTRPAREYCVKQAEHIKSLIQKLNPEGLILDQLNKIVVQWEELAGPPPFPFGELCKRYKLFSPDLGFLDSKEEIQAQLDGLKQAMREDLPPYVRTRLRRWQGVWKDRFRIHSFEFGTPTPRKGPSAAEKARKERARARSVADYEQRSKRK